MLFLKFFSSTVPEFLTSLVPILKKEFITLLRTRKAYVFLLLTVIFSILFCSIFWPSQGSAFYTYGAEAGRTFFIFFSFALLGLVSLITTAFTAGSFTTEYENQTYDLLFLTLISPPSILLAKLISSLGFLLLLITSLLPVLSSALLIGGVRFSEIAQSLAVLVTSIVTFGVIGMACSLIFRRTVVSLVVSEVCVLFIVIGQLLLLDAILYVGHWLAYSWQLTPHAYFERPQWVLLFGGPFVALKKIAEGPDAGTGALHQLPLLIMAQMFFIATVLFIYMVCKVRKPPAPRRQKQKKIIEDPQVLKMRRRRFPFYLTDPLRRSAPIRETVNPLLVKEWRYGLPGRIDTLLRLFYVSFILFLIIGFFCSGVAQSVGFLALSGVEIVLLLLFVPGSSVTTTCREERQGNVDALRMTLMAPAQIVKGKFLGTFLYIAIVAGAGILVNILYLTVLAHGSLSPMSAMKRAEFFIVFLGSLFVCLALACSVGVFSAIVFKRTTPSLILAYVLFFVLFAGNIILMIIEDIYNLWFLDERIIGFLSPLTGYIYSILRSMKGYYWHYEAYPRYSYWLGNLFVFSFVSALFYFLSCWIFKTRRMQD